MQQPISNRSNKFELNYLFLFVGRVSFMQKSAEIVVLLRTVEMFSIGSGCPSNLYTLFFTDDVFYSNKIE